MLIPVIIPVKGRGLINQGSGLIPPNNFYSQVSLIKGTSCGKGIVWRNSTAAIILLLKHPETLNPKTLKPLQEPSLYIGFDWRRVVLVSGFGLRSR